MDQSNALADALLKTPSLLGGLLSQMSDSLGSGFAESGMFSNLLSQSEEATASLASLAQTQAMTPAVLSSSNSFAGNNGNSSGALLQNLSSLSSTLHNVLNTLRQQNSTNTQSTNANSQASSGQQTVAQTDSAQTQNQTASQSTVASNTQNQTSSSSTATTATPSSSTAATTVTAGASASASTAVADTDQSSDDKQVLAEIVAELLMLTQLMIKNLQDPKTAIAAQGGSGTNAMDSVASATATSANGAGNPLLQLLTLLQQSAKQLMPTTDDASEVPANTVTSPVATSDTPSAIAKELAALDASLKNVLSAIQTQNTTTTAAVVTAQNTNTTITGFTARAMTTLLSSDTVAKSTTGDTWQSQMFGILGGGLSQVSPTSSGQAFAASAAMAISADKNSGSPDTDSNSESLFNNNDTSTLVNAKTDGNISAEGTQATGTYTFASQLSAFRAANGGTTGLPTAVDQVILQMNRSVKSGQDQMSLQLQPGDLGKITVKLDFGSDGKVQGTVIADNPKTLDMLQKDSRSLERALQDAGLRADPGSLQFSLGGQQNQNNNSGQAASNNGSGAANTNGDGTDDASDELAMTDASTLPETYYLTPGGVNIRV
jgi:flagellar hook-length control protein FliK